MNESSKKYNVKQITSFLKVFHILLNGISKWTIDRTIFVESSTAEINSNVHNELELCQKWLNLLQLNSTKEDEEDNDNVPVVASDEDKPIELPQHIQITLIILKRCIKYISTRSKMDKCLAIDSIRIGIEIIKTYENELLPMVHEIWPPFVERFKEQDIIVQRKCYNLLIILGRVAKDFIYKRMKK